MRNMYPTLEHALNLINWLDSTIKYLSFYYFLSCLIISILLLSIYFLWYKKFVAIESYYRNICYNENPLYYKITNKKFIYPWDIAVTLFLINYKTLNARELSSFTLFFILYFFTRYSLLKYYMLTWAVVFYFSLILIILKFLYAMFTYKKILEKYPDISQNNGYSYVGALNVPMKPPVIQNINNVIYLPNYPITTIKFKKNQTVETFLITSFKTTGGHSNAEDFKIYLNGAKIRTESIDIEITDVMNDYDFSNVSQFLKEDNVLLIESLNDFAYGYSNSNLVYFAKTEKDSEMLDKIWNEWEYNDKK